MAAISLGPQGQIAFLSDDQGHTRHVSITDLATGKAIAVGRGPWDDAPVWSPDGSQLAFGCATAQSGQMDIQVVDADGGHLHKLALQEKAVCAPSWSPDGSKLAYVSGLADARRVRVYDLKTDAEREWGDSKFPALSVVWRSPTALVAVFDNKAHGARTTDLFSVEEDQSNPLVPTRGGGEYIEWNPAVSRRAGILAYESNDGGDREIFVDLPGRGVIDVSNHRAPDWSPVWSTDGKWLAFESFRSGRRGIYKVSPQQSVVTPIAVEATSDAWCPSWSPDGQFLVFVSTHGGNPSLFIVGVDGVNSHAVVGGENGLAPAWRPRGAK